MRAGKRACRRYHVAVIEFSSCRPNLEVDDLAPAAAAFLREVLGFEVEMDEPEMGLALARSATPGAGMNRSNGFRGDLAGSGQGMCMP